MLAHEYDDDYDLDTDQGLSPYEQIYRDIHVKGAMEGVNRYNPENLKNFLEEYVDLQLEEGKSDMETNLSILKLYQLNPDAYNPDTTGKILLLAMVELPKPDFSLARCLLDQPRLDEEEITQLLRLGADYEQCRFEKVWETVRENPGIPRGFKSFDERVRQYACYVISLTYQNLGKSILKRLLGEVNDIQLEGYAKQHGWKVGSDYVYITNMEDTVKSRNIAEKIDFASVQDVLKLAVHT